jgi:hypothetical protein
VSRARTGGRPEAVAHLNALDRLLGLKDRAQYDRRSVGGADAQAAVRRAATLVHAAEGALRN